MIVIRPATLSDIASLNLRPEDAEELAFIGGSMRDVAAVANPTTTMGAWDGDQLVAVFGMQADHDLIVPWMLSSPAVSLHGPTVLRRARAFMEALRSLRRQHPGCEVRNVVSAANLPAQRFIKRLGFVIDPMPVNGLLRFYLPHV